MDRKRYTRRKQNSIWVFFKNRLHYKLKIKQIILVLIILFIIFVLKLLNNNISSNVIEIIDNSINYEVSLDDGKRILGYSKKLTKLSGDALSVFKIKTNSKHPAPIQGSVYNPFGETVYLDGRRVFNEGIDIIPSGQKEPVAIEAGVVKKVEDRNTKGYFVTIDHENMTTVYGYLISSYVSEGEELEKGSKIGDLGTNKDGNKYLHFQIWVDDQPVNPVNYVDFNKKL